MIGLKSVTEDDFPEILTLNRSKRAKRLALRVDSHARTIKLTIPHRMSLRKAHKFVQKHTSWIDRQQSSFAPTISFIDGSVIPILGNNITLNITYDKTLKRTSIELNNKELLIRTNKEDPTSRITRYLKKLAKEQLTLIAKEKAIQSEKEIKSVTIRDPKRRWGSCSSDGKISLSWRLIFAPREAMDYVVAHEVAHLTHMNHSRDFWNTCESLSLDYNSGKQWMKQHGMTLAAYGALEDK